MRFKLEQRYNFAKGESTPLDAGYTPMTYNHSAVFVETSHFTHWVLEYLGDEEYRELQQYLMEHPEAGQIIRGSGGIRKLRWSRQVRPSATWQ